MRSKFILAIFTALLFVSLVNAAPPQATDYGYSIRSGIANSVKINTAQDFHAHVFDAETGEPIISGISCDLHIYKADGHHQFEGTDTTASHTYDYSWDISAGNFSEMGFHEYIIQCNSSSKGGFNSASYDITESGLPFPDGVILGIFILFSIAAMFGLLYSLLKILQALSKVEVDLNTIVMGYGFYIFNLIFYYFLINFMPMDLMIDLSLIGMSAFGFTHIFLPLIGLIFSWIKNGRVE